MNFEEARIRKGVKKEDLKAMMNVTALSEEKNFVHVYVTKKLAPATIQKKVRNKEDVMVESDIIPKEVSTGLFKKKKTDVIEIGEIKAQVDRNRYRPLRAGCEIGVFNHPYVGTLGAFVTIKKINGLQLVGPFASFMKMVDRFHLITTDEIVALTNSHVANKNISDPRYASITQPGTSGISNIIGEVIYSYPLKIGSDNFVDAAIVGLEDVSLMDGIMGTLGKIEGFADCIKDEAVHKYGRTTQLTQGKCIAKNVFAYIQYGELKLGFHGLDMFSGMSAGGDSGSVIVRTLDNKAVSLLFAGSDTVTFGIPMNVVAKYMNIFPVK